jgi:L-rhamnose isomerase/sugar isomerase
MARYELGGAIDPIAAYRASEWRVRKAQVRKPIAVGQAGIV